jgi:4-oxalocrotonate tautomerase
MPTLRVSLFPGRTVETKRKLAEAFTQAFVEIGGAKREGVEVIFEEIHKDDWIRGGWPDADADKKD